MMSPQQNVPTRETFTSQKDNNIMTHSFSLADYVVIHNCDPICAECEFINISNKEALKLGLKEEKMRNQKYRERFNDVMKKYGQSLRQVKYLKNKLDTLTRQLMDERRAKNDIEVVDSSIDSDDDLFEFKSKPKLEIILE